MDSVAIAMEILKIVALTSMTMLMVASVASMTMTTNWTRIHHGCRECLHQGDAKLFHISGITAYQRIPVLLQPNRREQATEAYHRQAAPDIFDIGAGKEGVIWKDA